jgi:hypothetical protein
MLLDVVKKNVGEGIKARADYSRGDKDGKIRFSEPSDKISEFATQLNVNVANKLFSKLPIHS